MDETDGCPTEAFIICGFKEAQNIGQQINYLVCVDEEKGGAATRAQTCASKLDFSWDSISACSSSQSSQVLQDAANYFATHSEVHGFPTIQINGKEPWSRDYETLMSTLCQTGISAGACTPSPSPIPPTPKPTPTPPSPTPSPQPRPTPSPSADACDGKDRKECNGSCTWCEPWKMCFASDVPCFGEANMGMVV